MIRILEIAVEDVRSLLASSKSQTSALECHYDKAKLSRIRWARMEDLKTQIRTLWDVAQFHESHLRGISLRVGSPRVLLEEAPEAEKGADSLTSHVLVAEISKSGMSNFTQGAAVVGPATGL